MVSAREKSDDGLAGLFPELYLDIPYPRVPRKLLGDGHAVVFIGPQAEIDRCFSNGLRGPVAGDIFKSRVDLEQCAVGKPGE